MTEWYLRPYDLIHHSPESNQKSILSHLSGQAVRMPYTPPSQQSPVVSRPETPSLSRSQSYIRHRFQSDGASDTPARPSLPRSTSSLSYLSKHRRSPSVTRASESNTVSSAPNGGFEANKFAESVDDKGMHNATSNGRNYTLLHR